MAQGPHLSPAVPTMNRLIAISLLVGLSACSNSSDGNSSGIAAPSDLTYWDATLSLMIGVPIAPLTPSVEGEVSAWSTQPQLPTGLSIDQGTGTISGTPAGATEFQEYTITASNPGGSTSAVLPLGVAPPLRHLIAGGDAMASVEMFRVDARTGIAAHDGWFDTEAGLKDLISHPSVSVAYAVVNSNPPELYVYHVRADVIAPVRVQSWDVGNSDSYGLAVDTNGRSLVVTAEDADELWVYPLASDGRVLTEPTILTTEDAPRLPVFAHDAAHLVLADGGDSASYGLSNYTLDSGGIPTGNPQHTMLNGFEPRALAAIGHRLFLGISGFNVNRILPLDLVDGNLVPDGSGWKDLGDGQPIAIAIQPTGRSLVALLGGAQPAVQRFVLLKDSLDLGASGDPFSLGSAPSALTYDSTGRFLFISAAGLDGLLAFETDPSDGSLFSRGAFRTRSGADHLAVVVGPNPVEATVRGVFVSDKGRMLSVGGPGIADGMIHQFGMDPTNGQLATSALPIPVGNDPSEALVHPRGSLLFILDIPAQSLWSMEVGEDGLLDTAQASVLSTPIDPRTMALNPLGTVLYLATGGAQGPAAIHAYDINQDHGALSLIGSKDLDLTPSSMLSDPTGHWLVAADASSGLLASIPLNLDGSVDSSTGVPQLTVTGGPSGMAFSRNGQDFFVAFKSAHLIRGYRLQASTGMLSLKSGSDGSGYEIETGILSEPYDIVHHPFETWIFATLGGTGDVIQCDYANGTSGATAAGISLGDLEISPLGRFLFVVDNDDRSVSGLRIGVDGLPVLQTSAPHVLDNPVVVRASVSWE
ncbi:MAG: hypothetical protein CMJ86_10535 [Planctomycetes bacterium]|nr:hypothetical protein [Planctomycetota bacterium]